MIEKVSEVEFLIFESTMAAFVPDEPKEGFYNEAPEGLFFVFEWMTNQ